MLPRSPREMLSASHTHPPAIVVAALHSRAFSIYEMPLALCGPAELWLCAWRREAGLCSQSAQQEGAGLGSGSSLASAELVKQSRSGNTWGSLETFVLWLTQVPKALAESPGGGWVGRSMFEMLSGPDTGEESQACRVWVCRV